MPYWPQLDYVITGCASGLGGQDLAVSVIVVEVGESEPFIEAAYRARP
jgi:hypothetical protein